MNNYTNIENYKFIQNTITVLQTPHLSNTNKYIFKYSFCKTNVSLVYRPSQKILPTTILPKAHYDVITVNKPDEKRKVTDDGTFDFVDSPLADKHLVPSGSSQSSRVNVKKGPNGQDYEYEYVYYYYDEDDELVGPAKVGTTERATTRAAPVEVAANSVRSHQADEDEVLEEVESPTRNNGRNR